MELQKKQTLPLVSIVLPAFNEAAIIEHNVQTIYNYVHSELNSFKWEVIIINDGSSDSTAEIANQLAVKYKNIIVEHHTENLNVGQALITGFAQTHGDYIIVMDIDLSYDISHIPRLLDTLIKTKAQVVVASPYMKGGKLTNVPKLRKFFSIWGNRFLRFFNPHAEIHTTTGLVRAYDGDFLRSLNLRSMDVGINPEIIYKTMLLRGRIIEIPGHLDWSLQRASGIKRVSSFKIMLSIFKYILSGFTFRPFMFYLLPGLLLLLVAFYVIIWIFINCIAYIRILSAPDNISTTVFLLLCINFFSKDRMLFLLVVLLCLFRYS